MLSAASSSGSSDTDTDTESDSSSSSGSSSSSSGSSSSSSASSGVQRIVKRSGDSHNNNSSINPISKDSVNNGTCSAVKGQRLSTTTVTPVLSSTAQPSDLSDDQNESSTDVISGERRKSRMNKDLKELMDSYPDVYGIRRSSRSRKEPERYSLQMESENSDDNSQKKTRSTRSKRKTSGNWDDSETGDSSASEDEDSDAPSTKLPVRKARAAALKKTKSTNARAARSRTTRTSRKSYESSTEETEEDNDEDEDEERTRRTTRKKVSYKEQSDHTDTDDIVEVDWGDYNAEAAEEGETVEKVLEHRMGKKGATGLSTAIYSVQQNGDPNDPNAIEKEQQFLIKWKAKSHMHNTWESEESLKEVSAKGVKKIENYLRREEDIKAWRNSATPEDVEYYDCQEEMADQLRSTHYNVERIISHQVVGRSSTQDEEAELDGDIEEEMEYLCKFEGLPYSECTWESAELIKQKFSKKIYEYCARNKSQKIPSRNSKVLRHRPKFVQLKQQPDYIGGKEHFKLRDYQLDGLNWLAHSWCKENSVILADEMGLGKTIQSICFLNYLAEAHGLYGPFLMVVPLSTMTAWQKEFEQWAPELNFIVYIGDVNSRNMIRSYEWCHPNSKKLKFNVLLTTYEILLKDRSFLGNVSWAVLGVDEAHRLKNDDSLLYKSLADFDTNHRVLITGTPLQNSLQELWALLHFIMPQKFETWEEFESEYQDCDTKGYSKLHKRLEPYLIRRVKKDVEKSLPAKVEQILRVEMTSIQKQYYKWILTKNYRALSKGVKGSFSGFANIMMELKKCCNHASLVRPTDEINALPPLTRVIRGGGKLVLLDKLLVRLKETGHRVLIFSQMVRMLDILSDYLTYRRFAFQRLDGSIKGELRKQALDHFNAEGSQDFCFLLSTRAGGLGINLATADTVIIFDSDWNPQNDLQAQARAHRIGQKNQVNIYRLVTKSSVEEEIIERAKRKMVLDHLVIQRMDTTGRTVLSKSIGASSSSNTNPFTKEELSQILKFGAEELFKEGDTGEEEPQVDIDEILKRAETREEPSATPGDELLGAFKVASFNFNEEDVNPLTQSTKSEKDWDQIIPEDDRRKLEEEENKKLEFLPPRSSRKATQQNSNNHSDSGEEYDPNGKDNSEDSDGEPRSRRRGRAKRDSTKETLKGFTEQELRRFIKSYKKFASPMKRLDSIAMDAELQEKPMADLKNMAEIIQAGCENAIREHEEKLASENVAEDAQVAKKSLRGLNFKLYGVTIFPKNILTCQQELEPLEETLPRTVEERKRWVLSLKAKDVKDWDVPWTIEDDSKLLAGIYEYGVGSWEQIKMDPSYGLADKILPDGDKKPQAKQLQGRVEHLLKIIQKYVFAQRIVEEVKKPRKRPVKAKAETSPSDQNIENEGIRKTKCKLKTESAKSKKSKENKKSEKEKKSKDKEKKKKRKKNRDLNAPAMHFTANAEPQIIDGDLPPQIFEQCKEKMRPVKKALKQLDKPDSSLSDKEQTQQFQRCLTKIGQRIAECLAEISDVDISKEWRNNLWTFVSKFTEYHPKQLYRLFRSITKKQEKHEEKPSAHSSVLTTPNNHPPAPRHTMSKYSSPLERRTQYSSLKEPYYMDKRPPSGSSQQSPVKRSRMDDYRNDSSRIDRRDGSPMNSSNRRSNWHPPSSSASYAGQDRYRPYNDRGHADKYHQENRNRSYRGSSGNYSSSVITSSQSSPYYGHVKPSIPQPTQSGAPTPLPATLHPPRDHRPTDWGV